MTAPDRPAAKRPSWTAAVGAAASVCLAAVSLTGPRHLVYDERYYVGDTTALLSAEGPTRAFLTNYPYPAGLSNAVALGTLEPLVGTLPPAVRGYNLVLLGVTVWACRRVLAAAGRPDPLGGGFLVLSTRWSGCWPASR